MTRRRELSRARAFRGVIVTTLVAASGCDDATSPYTSSTNPPPYCPASDTANPTPFIAVTSASFPDDEGFNFDGINNAQAGSAGGGEGGTVAGCGVVDLAGGRDNEFAGAADAGSALVPLGVALDASLDSPAPSLEIRLLGLYRADVATDPCVSAELRIGGEAGVVVSGKGELTDRVASIAFDQAIPLAFEAEPVPAACEGGVCKRTTFHVRIERPIAVIRLDAVNRHVLTDSMLGGYVFVGSDAAEYDGLGATEFSTSLTTFATASGMTASATASILDSFVSRVDLHATPDLAITPCSTADTPNAISFAMLFSGDPPF